MRAQQPSQPFFHFGINWLVIGLPVSAVLAGFVTLALALANPDPVLRTDAQQTAPERPALEGRNHAATGGKPGAQQPAVDTKR